VQLFSLWALNVVTTALVASGVIAFIATLVARRLAVQPQPFGYVFLALAAFTLLGFVVGYLTGSSREAAVGTVVPAVLTLIGGAAAYIVDTKGVQARAAVPGILVCFTIALLLGSMVGLRLRVEYLDEVEQPDRLRQRDLALEFNKRAIEIQRLENYIDVLKLQRDFAKAEKLDLSKFEHSYEKKNRTEPISGQIQAAPQSIGSGGP
jgi:hypothetical protein